MKIRIRAMAVESTRGRMSYATHAGAASADNCWEVLCCTQQLFAPVLADRICRYTSINWVYSNATGTPGRAPRPSSCWGTTSSSRWRRQCAAPAAPSPAPSTAERRCVCHLHSSARFVGTQLCTTTTLQHRFTSNRVHSVHVLHLPPDMPRRPPCKQPPDNSTLRS